VANFARPLVRARGDIVIVSAASLRCPLIQRNPKCLFVFNNPEVSLISPCAKKRCPSASWNQGFIMVTGARRSFHWVQAIAASGHTSPRTGNEMCFCGGYFHLGRSRQSVRTFENGSSALPGCPFHDASPFPSARIAPCTIFDHLCCDLSLAGIGVVRRARDSLDDHGLHEFLS
jgi:hypothetical protein